jgi:hypothetical protein
MTEDQFKELLQVMVDDVIKPYIDEAVRIRVEGEIFKVLRRIDVMDKDLRLLGGL